MLAAIAQEENVPKTLRLAKNLVLPFKVVTEKIGILGATGSGKTTTASVLVEELLRQQLPVDIIDPTDAWWGLRSSKDGKSEGFPVTVLGGDHGDVPLEETAGAVIADLIAEQAPPLVISLAHFTKSAMRRFLADFAERLYLKNRRALHLVWDEADEAAPQNPQKMKGGERLFGAVDQIVRRGRIRGLGVTMISQRSAEISKSILSQCSVLIAHRASHPTDLEPIFDWMKANARDRMDEVRETIAKLKNGEAWVMSPELLGVFDRFAIRDRETFNSSATPAPGEEAVVPRRLAKPDLALLQEKMKDTIERARANDPAALRRRVADLERELAKERKTLDATAAVAQRRTVEKRVEVPVLKDAQIARVEKVANRAEHLVDVLQRLADGLRLDLSRAARPGAPPPAAPRPAAPALAARRPLAAVSAPRAAPSRRADASPPPEGDLPPAAERMLAALRRAGGTLTRTQLATVSGYSPSGGGFRNTLSALSVRDFVRKIGEQIVMTDVGAAFLGGDDVGPLSPEETRGMWREKLAPAAWRMLEIVLAAGSISRADLAEASGYEMSGGGFRNTLSALSSNALIVKEGDQVRAAEMLVGGAP